MGAFGSVATSAGYSASYAAVRYMHDRMKAVGGSGIKDIMTYLNQNPAADLGAALTNASHGAFSSLANFNTLFNANGANFNTDFASETAELTRSQILQQSAMAMVTQANAVPSLVMQLLR